MSAIIINCPHCGGEIHRWDRRSNRPIAMQASAQVSQTYHRVLRQLCSMAPRFLPDARQVRYSDVVTLRPQQKATADKRWLAAARLRSIAVFACVDLLKMSQADAGRASGLSKAAVSLVMRRVEDDLRSLPVEQLYDALEEALLP